jgi:hypothetical protein
LQRFEALAIVVAAADIRLGRARAGHDGAIHCACEAAEDDASADGLLKALLKRSADPMLPNSCDGSPLLMALRSNSEMRFRQLLAGKAADEEAEAAKRRAEEGVIEAARFGRATAE